MLQSMQSHSQTQGNWPTTTTVILSSDGWASSSDWRSLNVGQGQSHLGAVNLLQACCGNIINECIQEFPLKKKTPPWWLWWARDLGPTVLSRQTRLPLEWQESLPYSTPHNAEPGKWSERVCWMKRKFQVDGSAVRSLWDLVLGRSIHADYLYQSRKQTKPRTGLLTSLQKWMSLCFHSHLKEERQVKEWRKEGRKEGKILPAPFHYHHKIIDVRPRIV